VEDGHYRDILVEHARALADVARAVALDATVPSCPEWDVAKLVRHTGTAHRWSAEVVRTRQPLSPKSIDLEVPDDASHLPDWLEVSATRLAERLAESDPAAECWTWTDDHRVGFWSRRMAFETVVHAWDGAAVLGTPAPFDTDLAVDGIDEHLGNLPFVVGESGAGSGETLHVHCTDRDGEWLLRRGPSGLLIRREHRKADVALRGPAADVFLVVLGRVSPTAVEVHGESSALDRWREVLHF